MIASVASSMTTVLPDTASAMVKPEAAPPQMSQAPQPEKPAASPAATPPTQPDTVALSNTAVTMSKEMNRQVTQRADTQRSPAAAEQDASSEKQTRAYLAAGKSFPPFMGNAEELKLLKESSPALYREILRMIIPPPFNLSPSDLQAVQGTAPGSSSAAKSKYTPA